MSVLKAAAHTHYNSREQVNPFSISGAIGRFESTHTHTHTSLCECDGRESLRRCMRFSRCSRVVRRHARCHTCCLPAGLPLKINHLVVVIHALPITACKSSYWLVTLDTPKNALFSFSPVRAPPTFHICWSFSKSVECFQNHAPAA